MEWQLKLNPEDKFVFTFLRIVGRISFENACEEYCITEE